jgi:hypothetical protein
MFFPSRRFWSKSKESPMEISCHRFRSNPSQAPEMIRYHQHLE